MRLTEKVLLGSLLVAVSATVNAQDSGYYGSASVASVNADASWPAAGEFNTQALNFAVGYQQNDFLAYELRYGLGFNDDTDNGVKFELDHSLSFLIQPHLYLSPEVALYGNLGLSRTQFSIAEYEESLFSFSYGAGVKYEHSPRFSYYLDWVSLVNDDSYDINTINLGIEYRF